MSGPPTNGGSEQQSGRSILTDVAYFATVAFLAYLKVLEGQAVVALLGFYGAGRVVTGATKNRAANERAYYDGAASARNYDRDNKTPYRDPPDDDDQGGAPKRESQGKYSFVSPPANAHKGGPSSPLIALFAFMKGAVTPASFAAMPMIFIIVTLIFCVFAACK